MACVTKMSDELKLYGPKDLADVSPFSVKFIQQNAADFGFVKRGRKYVATREMIERSLEESSTSSQVPSFGTSRLNIVGGSLESPLEQRIKETLQELKDKRRDEKKSRL